jgi:hypothetical protein
MPTDALETEIAHRLKIGYKQLTVKEFTARFAALGVRLDRTLDTRCVAQYLDDGRTYPCISTYPRSIETGLSMWHVDTPHTPEYADFQRLRGEIFAVTRNAILEV